MLALRPGPPLRDVQPAKINFRCDPHVFARRLNYRVWESGYLMFVSIMLSCTGWDNPQIVAVRAHMHNQSANRVISAPWENQSWVGCA